MIFEVGEPFVREEIETIPLEIKTKRIAPEGLGFGHGSISVQDRLQNPDDGLEQGTLQAADEVINSDTSMVPVQADDDGCPDGRGTAAMILGEDRHEAPSQNKHRYKVFGGGSTMATAALIGNGAIDPGEENVANMFEYGMFRLDGAGMNFGAHSAVTAADGKSGCGAIDEAPTIMENVVEYRENIRSTIDALIDPLVNRAELDGMVETAIDNFETVTKASAGYEPTVDQQPVEYRGGAVLSKITGRKKKVAELEGEHKEVAIVINVDLEDMTFDQNMVRKATGGKAQVFPVDVPRMKQIADKLFEYDHDKKQAVISMLIYSLGTAATLTKGDLPVDLKYQDEPYISLDFSI